MPGARGPALARGACSASSGATLLPRHNRSPRARTDRRLRSRRHKRHAARRARTALGWALPPAPARPPPTPPSSAPSRRTRPPARARRGGCGNAMRRTRGPSYRSRASRSRSGCRYRRKCPRRPRRRGWVGASLQCIWRLGPRRRRGGAAIRAEAPACLRLNFNRVPRKGRCGSRAGSRRSGGQRLLESYEDEADWIQVDESDITRAKTSPCPRRALHCCDGAALVMGPSSGALRLLLPMNPSISRGAGIG